MVPPAMGPDAARDARRAFRVEKQARAQALTEWRHIDLRPLEQAARDAHRSVGEVLPTILSQLGFDKRLTETQIQKVWLQAVDPVVAAHAQPVGLRNRTLFVTVDSNLWLSEIVRYHRHELLERLQNAIGKDQLAKISYRLG